MFVCVCVCVCVRWRVCVLYVWLCACVCEWVSEVVSEWVSWVCVCEWVSAKWVSEWVSEWWWVCVFVYVVCACVWESVCGAASEWVVSVWCESEWVVYVCILICASNTSLFVCLWHDIPVKRPVKFFYVRYKHQIIWTDWWNMTNLKPNAVIMVMLAYTCEIQSQILEPLRHTWCERGISNSHFGLQPHEHSSISKMQILQIMLHHSRSECKSSAAAHWGGVVALHARPAASADMFRVRPHVCVFVLEHELMKHKCVNTPHGKPQRPRSPLSSCCCFSDPVATRFHIKSCLSTNYFRPTFPSKGPVGFMSSFYGRVCGT